MHVVKFQLKQNFFRHKKTHESEKVTCEACEKLFSSKETLNKHMKLHDDIKIKFTCEFCNKQFARKDGLTRHLKMHDTNYQRKYSCDICKKDFFRKDHLDKHKLSHKELESKSIF